MTDNEPEATAPATPYRGPPIVILVQYLKDLSFESPNAPAILNQAPWRCARAVSASISRSRR